MKQLYIEKLVHGGLGLARTDQGITFVSDVLPGEKVEALLNSQQAGQQFATPVTIAEPSLHRRKPPCAHFGICGGCDWLFGDYEVQLSSKKEIFIECLTRIGKCSSLPAFDVFPSPEFGYRRRVQFKINTKQNAIGFYKRNTREVVPIRHCPLLMPGLNALLADSEEIIQCLPSAVVQMKCIEGVQQRVASFPVIIDRTFASTEIRVGNYAFMVSGDGFFQGNAFLCEKLGTWGKDIVKGDYFVDLYGGVGFFSIMLHHRFKKGIIIDTIESQIDCARRNLRNNGILHITAQADSAENFLSKCSESGPFIDCLFVDPPRPGLTRRVRECIVHCKPSTIFYVSCNPSTQARDIGFFISNNGYSIEKMALFDLYPNTHHMETIVVLRR
jgi:23S rRNA (uracil1939-C5)-methyltransferase